MSDLKNKAKSAMLWDLTGTIFQQGVGFIIQIFLARLLEPNEFGLVTMSLVVINILQVFTDFGFASALIQNKNNTSLTYSSIFYLNLCSGLLLFGVFQLIAPLIGRFYHQDTVTELVRILALNFVFSSINIVQRTILRKNINFKKLTIRNMVSQVIGGVIGIVMAFNGYGVYALVVQNLAATIINTLILWRVSEWYPKLEFSWMEVKRLSGFSIFVFLDQVVSTFFNRMDTLFIGKFFSPVTLGFYSRADSLNVIIEKYSTVGISRVFFPVMSRIEDNKKFLEVYYKVVSLICFLAFGIGGVFFLMAHEIITVLFGHKWLTSVFIFQILIFKEVLYPVNSMMVNVYLSKGKSRENFYVGIFRKVVLLIPIAIGIKYGFYTFLIARVSAGIFLTITNLLFLQHILGASFLVHFRKIFEGAAVLIPFAILYFNFLEGVSVYIKMASVILYSVVYIMFNWLIKNEGFVFFKAESIAMLNKVKTVIWERS